MDAPGCREHLKRVKDCPICRMALSHKKIHRIFLG